MSTKAQRRRYFLRKQLHRKAELIRSTYPFMFDNARWPNGPKICIATNLPAFETPEALETFRETNAPSGHVIAQWRCTACGLWHYWGQGHDPSGGSSATTRTGKHIDEIREKFLTSEIAKTMPPPEKLDYR